MKNALKVAVIGLGGYARHHHESLLKLEAEGIVQVVATCDTQLEKFAATGTLDALKERGIAIYDDYIVMLDAHREELDFVTIPTPIPLHAPMHRACVERGLAVYLEKPPTLDWREMEAMLEVEQGARFATQVGFNFIVETPRQSIKARLLAGEFGALKSAGFVGLWPRSDTYYQRAAWAGKLRTGPNLILDSCIGNALAHYIHNLLFWYGQGELLSWGEVESVEAELYRAHPIESFDTVFARGLCNGLPVYAAASHAGSGGTWHREWLECENATINYTATDKTYEITWADGRQESGATDGGWSDNLLVRNLRHYIRYLNGEEPRALITLEDSRPFVHFNDLVFVAANHITTVPANFVTRETKGLDTFLTIQGIDEELRDFIQGRQLPSEKGVPWAKPGGSALKNELPQLEPTIDRIIATDSARLATGA